MLSYDWITLMALGLCDWARPDRPDRPKRPHEIERDAAQQRHQAQIARRKQQSRQNQHNQNQSDQDQNRQNQNSLDQNSDHDAGSRNQPYRNGKTRKSGQTDKSGQPAAASAA